MKLEINGATLDVPADYVGKLSEDLWQLIEQQYTSQIPDEMKIGLMIPVRALLYKEEMDVRRKYGKEAALAMRPPPKSDVNLWLFRQFLPYIREQLNGATIVCEVSAQTVTAFHIRLADQGISGQQVDTYGNERLRQDNGAQVS